MGLEIFDRSNLAPWCIVPYDTVARTPLERAEMVARAGFTQAAWDWRPEHVADFPAQLDAFERYGIALTALWVNMAWPDDPSEQGLVDPDALAQIDECARRGLTPTLWVCTEFGPPGPWKPLPADAQAEQVRRSAEHLAPLTEMAAEHGMDVGLYNHLGWFGEPENQIAVADALADRGLTNVGLVYVQHHGHAHLDRFASLWPAIHSRVLALALNGMVPGAHGGERRIHPYGHGAADVGLARVVVESGWRGPVALLGHTMDDAEHRLLDNLEGLDWVAACLRDPATAPAAPPPARVPEPVWPH